MCSKARRWLSESSSAPEQNDCPAKWQKQTDGKKQALKRESSGLTFSKQKSNSISGFFVLNNVSNFSSQNFIEFSSFFLSFLRIIVFFSFLLLCFSSLWVYIIIIIPKIKFMHLFMSRVPFLIFLSFLFVYPRFNKSIPKWISCRRHSAFVFSFLFSRGKFSFFVCRLSWVFLFSWTFLFAYIRIMMTKKRL